MPATTPVFTQLEERVWTAQWEDIYVAYWRRSYTAPLLREAAKILGSMQATQPGRVVVFSTMRVTDISMADARNQETRTAGEEMARFFEGRVRAQASVLEGQGFVAAAIRSAAVGLQLLVKNSYQVKIFEEQAPALADCGRVRGPRGQGQVIAQMLAGLLVSAGLEVQHPQIPAVRGVLRLQFHQPVQHPDGVRPVFPGGVAVA